MTLPATVSAPPSATRQMLAEVFSVRFDALHESEGTKITPLPNGRFRVRCKGQHCDMTNRNGRRYPAGTTWGKHTLPEAAFMARVKARRVIGQLEHPESGRSAMGLAAVCLTEVSPPDSEGRVFIEFETMSTPGGQIVASFIRDSVGFGVSSRGNGSVQRSNEGVDVVQPDFEPVTFDLVIDESTPGAEVAATKLREARASLVERVGGDQLKADQIAEAQTRAALARDLLSEQMPPRGDSEFLLAIDDGSAYYRAYDNGIGQWDVWFHPHNLDPIRIATAMPTFKNAKQAAEEHLRLVVGKDTRGTPNVAAAVAAPTPAPAQNITVTPPASAPAAASGAAGSPKIVVNVESLRKLAEDARGEAAAAKHLLGQTGFFDKVRAIDLRDTSDREGFMFDVGHVTVVVDEHPGDAYAVAGEFDIGIYPRFTGQGRPRGNALWSYYHSVNDRSGLSAKQVPGQIDAALHKLRVIEARTRKETTVAKNAKHKAVRESYVVADGVPFSGTMLTLKFETADEAEDACDCIADAGFNCWFEDDEVVVYTSYEQADQAIAHVQRVLSDEEISMTAEGARVAILKKGRIVQEGKIMGGKKNTRNEADAFPHGSEYDSPDDWKQGAAERLPEDDDEIDPLSYEADEVPMMGGRTSGVPETSRASESEPRLTRREWRAYERVRAANRGTRLPEAEDDDDKKDKDERRQNEADDDKKDKEKDEAKKNEDDKDDDKKDERRQTEADKDDDDKKKDEADDKDDDKKKKDEAAKKTEGDDDKDDKKKDEAAVILARRQRAAVLAVENARAALRTAKHQMAEVNGIGYGAPTPIDDPEDLNLDLDRTKAATNGVANKPAEIDPNFTGGRNESHVITLSKTGKPVGKTAPAPAPRVENCGHTGKIRYLENEIARLESQNAKLTDLVDQMVEVRRQEVLKTKLAELVRQHPALEKAREQMEACESVAAVEKYALGFLSALREAKQASTAVSPIAAPLAENKAAPAATAINGADGSARGTTTVSSTKTEGAPSGPLLHENSGALLSAPRKSSSAVDDTAGRVAEYRRRHRRAREG